MTRRDAARRTPRGALVAGVAVAVLLVAGLLATGLGGGDSLAASPLTGRTAPQFDLPGLPGQTEDGVRLEDLRGQVVVVNFWASWCAECHEEQAALNETWQRFRDAGVVVVGVNFEDAAGDARDYVASTGTSYPVVVDTDSSTALAYGLRGVPETFVIDRSGRLVDRVVGPATAAALADRIAPLLAEEPQ
jgi:cytochrome c biogenesis protein CcmG, thiol:disulfide interchange protein DsbE